MYKLLMFAVLLFATFVSMAEEVTIKHQGLTLNAQFKAVEEWQQKPVMLITHGTIFHNASELMVALQNLFAEQGYASLAINLGLNIDDRHGPYDCKVPHTHLHEDAITEIALWQQWLTTAKEKYLQRRRSA